MAGSPTFGEQIRQGRKEKGMTQRAFAQAVGNDFTYLSKIETGALPPPVKRRSGEWRKCWIRPRTTLSRSNQSSSRTPCRSVPLMVSTGVRVAPRSPIEVSRNRSMSEGGASKRSQKLRENMLPRVST